MLRARGCGTPCRAVRRRLTRLKRVSAVRSWASVITAGATGFLITGLSAYVHQNLVFFLDASEIQFFPQGLVSAPERFRTSLRLRAAQSFLDPTQQTV